MSKLPRDFYIRDDVLRISRELLGKLLVTRIDGVLTAGKIVETEAYHGITDKASHAYGNRRTQRTEVMFGQGGASYIYLCYGIHHLFNVVTNVREVPHAVLVRAIEPVEGIPEMMERRKKKKTDYTLTAGPGSMSQALGITTHYDATDLQSDLIWIEDRLETIKPAQIIASPRVGVDYAGKDARLPWRFRIKDNPWTSKAK